LTYIWAMPKRPPRSKLFEWRVIRIKSTPAALVGYFPAADADQAIQAAIERFNDPHQLRVMIQRLDLNDAKEWSEMDIADLKNHVAHGRYPLLACPAPSLAQACPA
jgi:hypothetical protein